MTLFYLFVVTAFVANAIVRDETTGFAPMVRATSVTRTQIVIGRFLGGGDHRLARYLSVPLGMALGSVMPWVDPETVGPQKLVTITPGTSRCSRYPTFSSTSALLFALATMLRSMLASYIGAVVLVMGYLVTTSIVGQKVEYRETFARFEPLGNGAIGSDPLLDSSELNTPAVGISAAILFNRLLAIWFGWPFLGLTVWRFSMTERAPSKRKLRKIAKREARDARLAAAAPDSRWRARGREGLAAIEFRPADDPAPGRGSAGPDQPRG